MPEELRVQRVTEPPMKREGLVEGLSELERLILSLPGGIDEDADPSDASPEDPTAHLGGLMFKRVQAIRAAHEAREVVGWRCPGCRWVGVLGSGYTSRAEALNDHDSTGCRATVRALVEKA